jgi:hypothetical protein
LTLAPATAGADSRRRAKPRLHERKTSHEGFDRYDVAGRVELRRRPRSCDRQGRRLLRRGVLHVVPRLLQDLLRQCRLLHGRRLLPGLPDVLQVVTSRG